MPITKTSNGFWQPHFHNAYFSEYVTTKDIEPVGLALTATTVLHLERGLLVASVLSLSV